jgi:hypothetical protein
MLLARALDFDVKWDCLVILNQARIKILTLNFNARWKGVRMRVVLFYEG